MRVLYQRLKELDSDTFEKFCLHLLRKRHPGADIEHVDGSGGDDGVDLFLGQLDCGPVVWQCKSFPSGVGKSQKAKIKSSLNRAVQKVSPKRWVLCLSVDMDIKTHRWFQHLAQSNVGRVDVGLMQASHIVHELIHRRTIREIFFPDAIIDTIQLREVLAKTGELTLDELGALTTENVHTYIDRLRERDARFDYRITFQGDRTPEQIDIAENRGSLVSIFDGSKTIDVLPRDVTALRVDPPRGKLAFSKDGAKKFDEFRRTGRSQEFGAEDVLRFSADLPFMPQGDSGIEFLSVRSNPSAKLPLRVSFGLGDSAVVYDLIDFRVTRAGTEEAELNSEGDLPFSLKLVVRPGGQGSIDLKEECRGADVHSVQKFLRAARQLTDGGQLQLYSLRESRNAFTATCDGSLPEDWGEFLEPLVADAVLISERYGVKLTFPDCVGPDDARALKLLKALLTGFPLDKGDFTVHLVKRKEGDPAFDEILAEEAAVVLRQPQLSPQPVVFGTPVPTGPVEFVGQARALDPLKFRANFMKAAVGDELDLVMEAVGPLEVRSQRHES